MKKIKNWVILILLTAGGVLLAVFTGRKSKFISKKEREVEKEQKKINIKNKSIDKGKEEIKKSKIEAKQAVNNYRELKKEHDKQIQKAGSGANVQNKDEKFDDDSTSAQYINDVLSDISSKDQ